MTERTRTTLIGLLFATLLVGAGCAAEVDSPPVAAVPGGRADDGGDAPDGPPASQVELKVTIAPEAIPDARFWFDLRDEDAERRYVTFYDTRELTLYEAGIVLRSRKVIDDDDDSTVKIRPLLAADAWALDPDLFADDEFKCELDSTPATAVSSCSLGAVQESGEIDLVAEGERDVDQLFSRAQEDFLAAFSPAGFDLDDAVPLGPVRTHVWKLDLVDLPSRLTIELWEMPDGTDLMEASLKVDHESSEAAMAALLDLLTWIELPLDTTQSPKTQRVLSYFASR